MKESNIKIYGYANVLSSPEIQEQIKETTMRIYGVEHVMHDPIIAQRASDNAYIYKDYKFPSSRIERVQGYENRALDDLLFEEEIHEDDIVTKRTDVPEIWWTDSDNNKHRYYVDIMIKSQKRCIEVKSTWTFEKKDIVFLKQQTIKNFGHKCEIWIYDAKKLVEKYY